MFWLTFLGGSTYVALSEVPAIQPFGSYEIPTNETFKATHANPGLLAELRS